MPLALAALLVVASAAPSRAQGAGASNGRWSASAAGTVLLEAWDYNLSQEEIYGGLLGVAYCPRERVSVGMELMLARVVQSTSDAFLKGASGIVGWEAWRRGAWSVGLETGLGVSTADVAAPRRGTRFNYLVHGGATGVWRVKDRCHLIGALRWLHLSNNSLAGRDRNPDIQALGGHVGIRVPLQAMWPVAFAVGSALAMLPRRYWRDLEERWPVFRMAWVSGLLTMILGVVTGGFGYFAYVMRMADAGGRIMMRGGADAGLAAHALAIVTVIGFAFFTPTGLFSVYLIVSGLVRAVAGFNDLDGAHGDPILTALDAGARRLTRRLTESKRRRLRESLEGPPVPDRILTGDAAGLPSVDLVVIASRRKAGWEPGVIVVTADHWYRLGKPFDKRFPDGLRTMYPLTRLKTVEVLRKYVRYEIAAIEEGSSQK